MNRIKILTMIGLTLLVSGITLLVYAGYSQNTKVKSLALPNTDSKSVTSEQSAVIQGQPTRLVIPSIDINLEIVPGYYNEYSKTWDTSYDKVQYSTITSLPNNHSGNTFLYGHAVKEVFEELHSITNGALAIVKTDNDHTFYYKLSSQYVTDPLDDAIFDYQGAPILTIQTCTGLFYQNRQMFIFEFEKVV
jgi:LPXTG-site transpeptidase (sortase) family protein